MKPPFQISPFDLRLDMENARRHVDRDIDAIAESLFKFGQQTPVVVTPDRTVIKGNGTTLAARKLKVAEIWAVETELTGDELRAYSIADNRTSDLSEFNEAMLAEQLQGLDTNLRIGFSDDELKLLEEQLADQAAESALDEAIESFEEETEDPEEPDEEVAGSSETTNLVVPLTLAQDKTVRDAIRIAKAKLSTNQTAVALAFICKEWSDQGL